MMIKRIAAVSIGAACVVMVASSAVAQTSTAQSAMVSVTLDSSAYEIEGTITWTFDKTAAATYYTAGAGVWNGQAPTCSGNAANCAAGNKPATPPAPPVALTGADSIDHRAQADRCIFWSGGTLSSWTYQDTETIKGVNGQGNWTFTYDYSTTGSAVGANTAWNSEETGGTVNVGFSGFVASESFQKQSNRNKYSFTMTNGGATRASNVSATLLFGTDTVGAADLNDVDTDGDLVNDALSVTPATADFTYLANGGIFGSSAVFGALHADARKPANGVVNILNGVSDTTSYVDNFVGNNTDLALGNVHQGLFAGSFAGLTEAGDYKVVVSGTLKGNSSSADLGFSVASSLIVIGGCAP